MYTLSFQVVRLILLSLPPKQPAEKGGVASRVDKFPVLRLSRAAISAALVFSGETF